MLNLFLVHLIKLVEVLSIEWVTIMSVSTLNSNNSIIYYFT